MSILVIRKKLFEMKVGNFHINLIFLSSVISKLFMKFDKIKEFLPNKAKKNIQIYGIIMNTRFEPALIFELQIFNMIRYLIERIESSFGCELISNETNL